MNKRELYFSTDVETDGPIPGPNSMLSFASAVFNREGELLGTFTANLETLPDAYPDLTTMAWWSGHPEAWRACRESLQSPAKAMADYVEWVKGFSEQGKPVFVGFPAGFDFLFMYWYMIKFTRESPFSFSALDGKTLAMALLRTDYRSATKRNYPNRWLNGKRKHTHVALDDAIEQGYIFCKMLEDGGWNA